MKKTALRRLEVEEQRLAEKYGALMNHIDARHRVAVSRMKAVRDEAVFWLTRAYLEETKKLLAPGEGEG